jgi:hypothetical protein
MNLNGAGRQLLTFEAIEVNSFWQNLDFPIFGILENRPRKFEVDAFG